MKRFDELTPSLYFKKKNFKKIYNPLQQTKDLYKKISHFEERELKEFSILFLIMNNLDIFRKNIEIISEIKLSNNLMEEF